MILLSSSPIAKVNALNQFVNCVALMSGIFNLGIGEMLHHRPERISRDRASFGRISSKLRQGNIVCPPNVQLMTALSGWVDF